MSFRIQEHRKRATARIAARPRSHLLRLGFPRDHRR